MTTQRLGLGTFVGTLCLTAFVAGCGDDAGNDGSDAGTDTDSQVTSASASETSDPSTTTTGDDTTTSDTSVDTSETGTTGGPDVCETFQCGDTCCESDEECVLGECRPACDSGVRCGESLDVCCPGGDVCLQPACVTPGQPCLDSYDCPAGEFCETTINDEEGGNCLPNQDPVVCEVFPDFEDIELGLEWSWEEEQIISMPIVADIDGDDLPEIIVSTTYHDDDENGDGGGGPGEGHLAGIIVVFAGESGEEQFRVLNVPHDCGPGDFCTSYGSYGRATIGVADVDGNGLPDIVYAGRPSSNPLNRSRIHAVNGFGQRLWSSELPNNQAAWIHVRHGAPTFANFDDDPESEIVYGAAILDNDGTLVWDQDGDGALYGSPSGYRGPISAVADLTGDGYPEIISGRDAWSVDWQQGVLGPTVTVTQLWTAEGAPDGFPAIADLDQNGTPEVILVAGGTIRVLEGATGELWCGVDPTGAACANNDAARTPAVVFPDLGVNEDRGGPPTVADFDGDGRPEFAAAGAGGYVVFDVARPDEDIVQPGGFPPPAPGDIFVKWYYETQDQTSRSTGSSVFDFQGDGVAEVLYGDECHFRVFNGQTGQIISEVESSSATIHEYPIVADSDGDGNSEILVVANDVGADLRCGTPPDYTPRRGLFVYGDPNDQWVRTRRVWNSHTYHVTNSDSRGLTPEQEVDNWTVEGLNNYRQNVQGEGIFNAPDLSVDLTVGFSTCLDEEFEIWATVRNEGSLGIPAGIEVSLYEGTDATGDLIGTQTTTKALLPGEFEVLSWTTPAPGGEPKNYFVTVDGGEELLECVEDNNSASTETVSCPIQG